jgi:hypothetical protein
MNFSPAMARIASMVRGMLDPAAARAELSERELRRIKTYNESLITIPGAAALVLLLPYALGLAAAAALLFLWFLWVNRRNARPLVDDEAEPPAQTGIDG